MNIYGCLRPWNAPLKQPRRTIEHKCVWVRVCVCAPIVRYAGRFWQMSCGWSIISKGNSIQFMVLFLCEPSFIEFMIAANTCFRQNSQYIRTWTMWPISFQMNFLDKNLSRKTSSRNQTPNLPPPRSCSLHLQQLRKNVKYAIFITHTLMSHQWGLMAFTWRDFHGKCSKYLSLLWIWKLQFSYYSLMYLRKANNFDGSHEIIGYTKEL